MQDFRNAIAYAVLDCSELQQVHDHQHHHLVHRTTSMVCHSHSFLRVTDHISKQMVPTADHIRSPGSQKPGHYDEVPSTVIHRVAQQALCSVPSLEEVVRDNIITKTQTLFREWESLSYFIAVRR